MTQRRPTRNELTEYSSLLRALRTSHTLDVSAHLTQAQEPTDADCDAPETEEFSPAPSTSTGERGRTQSEPELRDWRNRDQWTRWPMLLKDIPPSDWKLQDEIGSIVRQVLRPAGTVAKVEEHAEQEHDSGREDEDGYIRHLTELITPVIETRLQSLFAIIRAHTVARPDNMQNRIEPFTWHDLSHILSSPMASHLVDETVLRNVIARMESLNYNSPPNSKPNVVLPPSPATSLHRQSLVHSSRSRLNNLLSKHSASLLEQTVPSPGDTYLSMYQLRSKKRRMKTARRRQVIEEEELEEDTDSKGLAAGTTKEVAVEAVSCGDDEASEWDGDL